MPYGTSEHLREVDAGPRVPTIVIIINVSAAWIDDSKIGGHVGQ